MKSLYTFYFALLMVLMGGLGQHQAYADLILDAGDLSNPVVVDFSQFATCGIAAPGWLG